MTSSDDKTAKSLAPRRKRDREGSTQALLQAAIEVFSERGYDAATTKEVAKRAGVAEALIQRYFDGKPGLLVAILEHFSEQQMEVKFAALPFQDSLEKELSLMLKTACELHKQHNAFIRVALSRAIVDPKVAKQLRASVHERRLPALVARLKHYQEKGQLKKDADLDAIAYGMSAIAFSVGFMGPTVFDYDPERLSRIGNSLTRVVADGSSPKA